MSKMSKKMKELPSLGDMFVQLSGKQTTHLLVATLNILKEVIVNKAMSKCSFVAQEIFGTRMSEVLIYFQYICLVLILCSPVVVTITGKGIMNMGCFQTGGQNPAPKYT